MKKYTVKIEALVQVKAKGEHAALQAAIDSLSFARASLLRLATNVTAVIVEGRYKDGEVIQCE